MWRLHRSTTEWQTVYVPADVRKKEVAPKRVLLHAIHVQPVAGGVGRCVDWAALVWYTSSLESRWMSLLPWRSAAATYCRTYVTSPASSYFNRTLLRRTGLVRRSWPRDSCFRLSGFVAAEQPRPQSNWLQNLVPDSATILPHESVERRRLEAASDWYVERNRTTRYWWRHWRVAQTSPCMRSHQRTLWISTVTFYSL